MQGHQNLLINWTLTGAGYGIIIAFGAAFALGVWGAATLLARFRDEVQGSEMFMTAKRSVKTGLVASAVVSSWTLAATLLTSTAWTYSYGVSGAYYYGSGATVQIFVFATAAIELKRRAPGAHTFLEVAKIRYGAPGHITFICFSSIYAIINCIGILIGGSAVFHALTGMSQIAGIWLLPIGVVIYTLLGGIKATILTDYVHTIIIYVMVLTGLFVTYATSNTLGSPDRVYELLREAAKSVPVAGNAGGEYLTMRSQTGALLGVVFYTAIFATTIDVQLFQKAITASPEATLPGYMIGGLSWFSIPFCLATTFGLAARAMENSPVWPTYPNPMTAAEVASGLPFPYAAKALMGTGGAVFVLLMVFMACTSGFSADVVSIAAVWTYDIYGTYINKNATGGRLVKVSSIGVVAWGICMAAIATGISTTTIGVNYLITIIGVFTACAVFPIYSTVLWNQQSQLAAVGASWLGLASGVSCWLGSSYVFGGAITVASTSGVYPLVIGNSVALFSGAIYSILLTFIFGTDKFDWSRFKSEIRIIDDSDVKGLTREQLDEQLAHEHITPEMDKMLKRARWYAIGIATVLCLSFVVLWPLPMYGTSYIFSKPFFRGWVVSQRYSADLSIKPH